MAGSTFQLYGRGGANVTVNPQPGLPLVAEIVTSGSQTSVTVSSIPQTYRDLLVKISNARSNNASGSDEILVQLNGDTGSHYTRLSADWNNTTPSSFSTFTDTGWRPTFAVGSTGPANYAGDGELQIFNYASTLYYKGGESKGGLSYGATTTFERLSHWDWQSTAAINSIKFTLNSGGSFVDGTVIDVYGIGGGPAATLPLIPPQGRLTLTSGSPVMTTDAAAQGTIYYDNYQGNMLPVGGIMYRIGEISDVLNATAHTTGNLYDVFAYNNAGTISLCTGPAWTSSIARNAAISQTNGIWYNSASLTCTISGGSTTTTIAIGQATYLGTFYATANGQTGMQFQPAAAAGGGNAILGLFNAYNQVPISSMSRDSNASWTYATTTWRATDNSNSNRVSYVDGLGVMAISARATELNDVPASSYAGVSVDRDSVSASPVLASNSGNGAAQYSETHAETFTPSLGFHYISGLEERAAGSGTITFYGGGYQSVQIDTSMFVPLAFGVARRRRRRLAANDNDRQALAA